MLTLIVFALSVLPLLAELGAHHLDGGVPGWAQNQWRVQVDGVMGGRSSGGMTFEDGALVFSGTINLNGGGFSSIRRSMPTQDVSSFAGIVVEMDSQTYAASTAPLGLHLQLHDSRSGWGYAAAFAVPLAMSSTERARVFMPLASFDRGSSSGRQCYSCALDPTVLNAMDVYVLFQEGPFEMRLRSITAVPRVPEISVPIISLSSGEMIRDLLQAAIRSGSSLYDKGYVELCISVYSSSLSTLLAATGPSDSIKGVACVGLNAALYGQADSKTAKAWQLRDSMDAILADIAGAARNSRAAWLPDSGSAATELAICRQHMANRSATSYSDIDASSSDSGGQVSGFAGPFKGMGISGHNDLGNSMVAGPFECAQRCLAESRCKSFDYGARDHVLGECWLSTATRASAPSAYETWELYDYFELQQDDGTAMGGGGAAGGDSKAGSSSQASAAVSEHAPLLLALLLAAVCFRS
eukprot:TRINITY_DN81144_c0_g1_i1.p1 TRINITY_DN81144_c0_g1~~TRINITY_DN81144_c0_g1_i1.p1  ORF type:complete len:469 (+),score=44.23 TRINITY_DN81144_c0_g1_i1:71-1477(+)